MTEGGPQQTLWTTIIAHCQFYFQISDWNSPEVGGSRQSQVCFSTYLRHSPIKHSLIKVKAELLHIHFDIYHYLVQARPMISTTIMLIPKKYLKHFWQCNFSQSYRCNHFSKIFSWLTSFRFYLFKRHSDLTNNQTWCVKYALLIPKASPLL